jgi:hypothetical protein
MQFVTVREPARSEFRFRFVGRAFVGTFHYRLEPEPSSERLTVLARPAPDARDVAALERFLPALEDGLLLAAGSEETRAQPLCCVRIDVTDLQAHRAALVPGGVHLSGLLLYRELVEHAQPLDPLCPEWLTSDVIALAKGVYANAGTDRYLVLSDALRDAGCDDRLIHDHLQLCPDHGPSCWVAEMILNQTRAAGA